MGVEYLLVNLTKRRYVDPGTVGSGSKRDGVSQGLFPEMITWLMLDEWRGDHVVLVGDAAESESALIREIHKCDPPEDLSFGQCSCEKSGKPHWRQDYRAIEAVYRRRAEEAMSFAEDFRSSAAEFANVCACGHLKRDHDSAFECTCCRVRVCGCSSYAKTEDRSNQ